MEHMMYSELVPWYRQLDPPEDHADEARVFTDALVEAAIGSVSTLLELGSGAGHNALHLKARLECTLTDIAEPMLDLSREMNPECIHVNGDMRTLRLGRTFDTVLVHDSICYMTSETMLKEAIQTAWVHTRPGGAALFAPDMFTETFEEDTHMSESDIGERGFRCIEWMWDPDPSDCIYQVDYAFLLREGATLKAVHDRHIEGLFPKATWLELLRGVGFETKMVPRPIGDGVFDEVFVATRPLGDAISR